MPSEGCLEIPYGFLYGGTVDVAIDNDVGWIDEAKGEFLFHDEECFPGLSSFRKDIDAVEAGLYLKIEGGGHDHGRADDDDADDRVPGDDAGD